MAFRLSAWLGWVSAIAAAGNLVMSLGIVVDSGLLVPGGTLTYALYALMAVWLVAVTTVMVVRLGKPTRARAIPATLADLHSRIGPGAS